VACSLTELSSVSWTYLVRIEDQIVDGQSLLVDAVADDLLRVAG
jgi:hypothetical protein